MSSQDKDKSYTVEEKWEAMRDTLSESADKVLGFEEKKQPDWYGESEATIEPALRKRKQALCEMAGMQQAEKVIGESLQRHAPMPDTL